jgi:hypothetical protein
MRLETTEAGPQRVLVLCLALSMAAMLASGCRRNRTIELAWDVPASLPATYRIAVDGRVVREMPPPQVDPSCRCLKISVEIPRGEHKVRVEACNAGGACTASAEVTAK